MAKKQSELKPTDEVVVKLGAKMDSQNGKTVTIEKERKVVMTKAGFDAIELDEDGHAKTLGRTAELMGTPKYGDETASDTSGSYKELTGHESFTKEKEAAPAA